MAGTTALFFCHEDTLAEWLRRRPAKPVGSARVGSNPTGVGVFSVASAGNALGKSGSSSHRAAEGKQCSMSLAEEERSTAAIAQLGERQTEDLEVPGSIPGYGILTLFLGD